ncbi:hypothetical protein CERZMDRAFT_99179 [Cercospora zeae-maydis SCOH1-5]|uniref:F-box domain-containing protein n=1 Tax=Cercospora zeae-maydis SCOH1-5 TaxID=717836 RepID=A0A6A6FAW3_9PEZI|nr:hypothetical protein CERZMDRAFT_99179 [Cercospora zeae-maydis SCOH1-5]
MDTTTPLFPVFRVEGTVELLELILTNLTVVDLTRCLRVCKRWHDMIISSPSLREPRFLAAAPQKEWVVCVQTQHPHRPSRVSKRWQIVDSDYSTAYQLCLPPAGTDPILPSQDNGVRSLHALGAIHPSLDVLLTPKDPGRPVWNATTSQLQNLASIPGLRRVLVTNPPSKLLYIKRPRSLVTMTFTRAAGFTIGVVAHLAQKYVAALGEVDIFVIGTVEERWNEATWARKWMRKCKKREEKKRMSE